MIGSRMLATTITLLTATLGPPATAAGPDTRPYTVATTVGMVADIVHAVAGEKATVTAIIGEGVDPHLYKPTRKDVITLMRADLIFYNGLHLEGKMVDTLERAAKRRVVVAVTQELDPQYLIRTGTGPTEADPHVWMDVAAWREAVKVVTATLRQFDPKNADFYAANGARLRTKLQQLDAYIQKVVSTIPETQRVLVTAHDAFSYFGKRYGLRVEGIQGLSTESEAGVRRINELVDLLVDRRVPAVFVESSVADKNVKALVEGARSRGHEVSIGGTLYSDAMGPPGTYEGTYIGMLDHNATLIARALGGSAPPGGMQGKLRGAD